MNASLQVLQTSTGPVSIGGILLDAGKISPQDAEQILRLQKAENLRFGDAAIKLGLVSEADIRQALAKQFDYPYLAPGAGGLSDELIAAYSPFANEMENLRSLRSQLMLRWFNGGRKALAFIGARPGEGVTNLVANLAVVFSQLGERTLLIDANLRDARQHRMFNLGNRAGLADVLAGRADRTAAIVRVPGLVELSVLPSGNPPPNPAELLGGSAMSSLLAELGRGYDVVLIDTTPASGAADFQSVAGHCGGAVLVARQNRTRVADLTKSADMLAAAGVSIVGSVLTQF